MIALGLLFGLMTAFALPGTSLAAAPPVASLVQPGPGLFNPLAVETDPIHMAMAVLGATPTPGTGSLTTSATLVAGVRVGTWNLEGVLTNRYSRRFLGAATLVGNGFARGAAPLTQVATLRIGNDLDCWSLIDTSTFRPLPPEWMHVVLDGKRIINDGKRVAAGGIESKIYNDVVIRAFHTSPAAFRSVAREDLTFTHLHDSPERYRGEVIHIQGLLRKIDRFAPTPEQEAVGISDLYEAWIFPEQFGARGYCVVFSHWPEGLSRKLLGRTPISEPVRVKVDGYFFKTFEYLGVDSKATRRDAALIVANTIIPPPPAPPAPDSRAWVHNLIYAFIAMFAALGLGILGVTFWFRRNDNRHRRRLQARAPEFFLPPPDAPPSAPPLARPVSRGNGGDQSVPMAPRITFPATGKGDTDRGDGPGPSEGKPPDEGAGA